MDQKKIAHLVHLTTKRSFPLIDRLTTIGSSKRSKIRINNEKVPQHCAYILFSNGNYTLHPVDSSFPVVYNGKAVDAPEELISSAILEIGKDTYLFEKNEFLADERTQNSSFHKMVSAINAFFRNVDHEARFELLNSICQTLRCDGARLVIEDSTSGEFSTIARFPQASNMDRFSERALIWAKQQKKAVLMDETDWRKEEKEKGSLELNNIGSIICMPFLNNNMINGYLYLDRLSTENPFTKDDWEICDALAPIFGDILALYDRTLQLERTIETIQKTDCLNSKSLIFSCEKMQKIVETALHFAKTDSAILLQGETGTGKEVFARLIHDYSNRCGKPFLVINCGAIPENLIESELFGHEKGAFTGASTRKPGLFESADGGTVFLDEIGELPLNLQVKLLRVLQESEVLPLGATNVLRIDTRVITATNRNLLFEVEKNTFRRDLYYRLNVLKVELPPLRERGKDIILIANFFIKKYSAQFGFSPKQISLTAQTSLLKHQWPGNIRELENIIQKAILVAKGTMIESQDLDIDSVQNIESAKVSTPVITLKDAREKAEKQAILNALEFCGRNVTMAANLLEVDRKWLTKLIKQHHIEKDNRPL